MLPATLYTKENCDFCTAARAEHEGRGQPYTEVDVTAHPERVPELLKLTGGRRVVPVIVDANGIRVAPAGGTSF